MCEAAKLTNAIDQSECRLTVLSQVDWLVCRDTVVRPDISVACGDAPPRHQETPPALVVEVLSDATKNRDTTVKRELYELQRVPWYFIADPVGESLIALCLDEGGQYESISVGEAISMELCGDCHLVLPTARLFK